MGCLARFCLLSLMERMRDAHVHQAIQRESDLTTIHIILPPSSLLHPCTTDSLNGFRLTEQLHKSACLSSKPPLLSIFNTRIHTWFSYHFFARVRSERPLTALSIKLTSKPLQPRLPLKWPPTPNPPTQQSHPCTRHIIPYK